MISAMDRARAGPRGAGRAQPWRGAVVDRFRDPLSWALVATVGGWTALWASALHVTAAPVRLLAAAVFWSGLALCAVVRRRARPGR